MKTSEFQTRILVAAQQVLQLPGLVLVCSGQPLWVEHKPTGEQWAVALPTAQKGCRFFKVKG